MDDPDAHPDIFAPADGTDDEFPAGFDLLDGTEGRVAWPRPVGVALLLLGMGALAWAFSLLLRTTAASVPSQSPVPLPDPWRLFGAFALALTLLCAGAVAWTLPGDGRAGGRLAGKQG